METKNGELKKKIVETILELNHKITDGFEEYNKYLEVLKYEEFNENLNETEDQSIKKAESILIGLDEMIKRNDESNKKLSGVIEVLYGMIDHFNKIVRNIETDKEKLSNKNNEIIDIVIDLAKRKVDKLILQRPDRKNELKGQFEDKKEQWNKHRINFEEYKRNKQLEVMKRLNNTIEVDEINQIEEWTQMKMGNVIFNSDVDAWNENTSVFYKKIINKSNLIFLVEDTDGNLFGGYLNTLVKSCNDWISDPKSFVFSLKSNGRLDGMLKFDIRDSEKAFYLNGRQPSDHLFTLGVGNDICVFREKNKNESHCKQQSYNYNGIKNALCGKSDMNGFIPVKITVFQLI